MEHILRCYGDIYDASVVRGEGCYVYDDQGNKYVDFEAGVWSAALGHSHPRVNETLHKQVDQIMHLGYRYQNPIVEAAARVLLEAVNFDSGKCIFLSSGSEAVEFAVQITRRITNRPLLLTLSGSYLGAYGSAGKRDSEEWSVLDWSNCQACTTTACTPDCKVMADIPLDRIGGFVMEAGSSWVRLPPPHLIQTLERRIREHGGLVVANEVTTGLGRTGKWFAYEHYCLKPDIVSVGKHLGNGYPVSAVAMTKPIGRLLERDSLRYAQSHQNDALGCAVASTVIGTLRDEGLVERSKKVGQIFKERLFALQRQHTSIREVRGIGLMLAIELQDCDISTIHRELFDRGYLVGFSPLANILRFFPPLTINIEDIDRMVNALDEVLMGR